MGERIKSVDRGYTHQLRSAYIEDDYRGGISDSFRYMYIALYFIRA